MEQSERNAAETRGAPKRWGVIGGGLLGLTLAHRLRQQGHQVSVFEGAKELGGLAGAWQLGDITWDRHYHVTLQSDLHLRAILGELDLDREIDWVETRTGVFARGQLYSVSNTLELLRFPVLGWIDVFRLGLTVLYASRIRDWQRLEEIPVADWLRRWSGRPTFERFWLPLLRSKLGDAYRDTSAAFIWATIQRLYAARRSGMKRELFGYVPGGYGRVLARFAELLEKEAVDIRLGCRVERVEATPRGVEVEVSGSVQTFDEVAVTVAAPLAARICRGLSEDERERLGAVRYLGIVCASVLTQRPLEGYYVTNLLDSELPFTGVIEMSALVKPQYLGGHSLVYLPRYLESDDAYFERSDDEISETFLDGLERVYPAFRRSDVLAFRISRVRQVMALSTLGYSKRCPPMTTSVPGVHLVSSARIFNGTLNVNETVQLAERAAEQLGQLQ